MALGRTLRPVLVCLAALATASCGLVEGDPQRFETLARSVADIPLDDWERGAQMPIRSAVEAGLRPAHAATAGRLRVEVMDPHDLWDARDAGLRGAIERATPAVVEAVTPVMAEAVAREVSQRTAVLRPARPAPALTKADNTARTTIQLGAYSSEAAARDAWVAVSTSAARRALSGLKPTYEAVQVNGRSFTRLKVAAPTSAAAAICRAAEVTDPWCARQVSSREQPPSTSAN